MRNCFPITIAERLLHRERLKRLIEVLRRMAVQDGPSCRRLEAARQQLKACERSIDRALARDGNNLTYQIEIKTSALLAAFEDLNFEALKGGDWLRKNMRWLEETENAARKKAN